MENIVCSKCHVHLGKRTPSAVLVGNVRWRGRAELPCKCGYVNVVVPLTQAGNTGKIQV